MNEKDNIELKNKVREHWNNNPMDYDKINAEKYSKAYYDAINVQFRSVAYFGQKKGAPFFSNLIDYSSIKNKQVLVVGCGAGTISTELAKHGAKLTAIDLTEEAVKNTKNQMKLNGCNGTILQADAEQLPFEDETFDFVWSWGVIHHTPNTQKAADQIFRVLKKGGKSQIMIYHKNSIFQYLLVYFIRGVIQGRLFKVGKDKLLNMYTDHSHLGGTPLAKSYTKKEAKKLFKKFKKIEFKVYGVKDELFFVPGIKKLLHKLPNFIPNSILRFWGWFLFVELDK
jgi:2-polyprenyl-3-methyl-5-hydroxy-6-metoxy-1,4-benzoquinol methylase